MFWPLILWNNLIMLGALMIHKLFRAVLISDWCSYVAPLPPSCEQDSRRPSDGPWSREENKQGLLCCEPQMLGNCLNREQFKRSLLWPVFKHQVVMRTECLVLLPWPPLGFSTHSRSQKRPTEQWRATFTDWHFYCFFTHLYFGNV